MKKNGFVFVETIIVTAILLASLMLVYSLFVSNKNDETKRLRYDDTAKLYETYYLKQYFDSFDLSSVTSKITDDEPYQFIYRGYSEIFGDQAANEYSFFSNLWEKLGISSIVVLPYDLTNILKCEREAVNLCSNKDLLAYLNTLDSSGVEDSSTRYRMIVEYSSKLDGRTCNDSESDPCFHFFSNIDFAITPKVYTISYFVNGGSGGPISQTKDYGVSVNLSSTVPTRNHYVFKNWNTEADGSGTTYNSGTSYSENQDLFLYAQWDPVP